MGKYKVTYKSRETRRALLEAQERGRKTQRAREREIQKPYYDNPVLCLVCQAIIPYKCRKRQKYCSLKCAAIRNNTGRKRKGREERIKKAVELRKKNYSYKRISEEMGISTNTVREWVKHVPFDKVAIQRTSVDRKLKPIHELQSKGAVRKRLLKTINKCETCSIPMNQGWQDKDITLELHHIDGDKHNHRRSNLLLLCPNCHSQTNNHRNKKR